jgi:2,3-bisphosphoglycerate-independent phosphoglycerate mutase
MNAVAPKPVVLLILDGWGVREQRDANAIAQAHTPVWDRLWKERPHALLKTSGAAVGLPGGQMGNSEVGHLNLGAGRVVYQEFTRVSRSIRTGSFFSNRTLTDAVDRARQSGHAVHVMGLLSPGGVHSHQDQIMAMLRLAVERGADKVYLHAFLDGRDTPPKSARGSLRALQDLFDELDGARIVSVVGRYFAMDRDNRWERIERAYDLLVEARADYSADSAEAALAMAYARGETDEFVQPTAIVDPGQAPVRVQDGDVVVFMNYRSDRARQLTRAFIDPAFAGFARATLPKLGAFVSLTEYNKAFDIPVAFPPERLRDGFGEYISRLGLRQLRLAETEKYAHVTFFFNGGVEQPFAGEDRLLIPSPAVATYDLQPEMSADEVTDELVAAIKSRKYHAIVCNYANADMVGHTGDLQAAILAIETLDHCLKRVILALHQAGGEMLITADHGNAEQMRDRRSGQAHTAHTTNPVPLIYVGEQSLKWVESGASLCDVAPTLLFLMGLGKPAEMNGQCLLQPVDEAG